MIDTALQRTNMVESQVRPSDVTDRRVIRAMQKVPRERFVPAALASVAYCDEDVAVVEGARTNGTAAGGATARYLVAPRLLARLIQALEIGDDALVLDVGTATGYSAAVLAQVAQTVVAIEEDEALAARASAILSGLGYDNAAVITGRLAEGHAQEGPYDAILLAGTVDVVPETLLDQLKDGGHLATVLTAGGIAQGVVFVRHGARFASRVLFEAAAPRLPGFARKAEFVF